MLPLRFFILDFARSLTTRSRGTVFVLGALSLIFQGAVCAQEDAAENANIASGRAIAARANIAAQQVAAQQTAAQQAAAQQAAAQQATAQEVPKSVATAPGRDRSRFEKTISPLLKRACFDCHSGQNVEGNFAADQLDPDLVDGKDIAWWLEVYSVLSKSEMPPPESNELTDDERIRIVDWLSTEIQAAEKQRASRGNQTAFRRLTRYEYNYALQDLLGVPWSFAGDLPAEASEDDAFENNAESLHMSVKQVETYHQMALNALRRVTVRGERPPVVHWSIPMQAAFQRETKRLNQDVEAARKKYADMPDKQAAEIKRLKQQFQAPANRSHYLDVATGLRAEIDWSYRKASYAFKPRDRDTAMPDPTSYVAVVQPGSREGLTVELGDQLPDKGMLRVRIRASRADGVKTRIPSLQLHFGFQATDQGRSIKRLSQQDVRIEAVAGQPEIYQWDFPLSEIEHRNTYRGEMKLGQQPSPSEYIRFTNSTDGRASGETESSAILIDYVEVAAPVYDQWPPQSHRNVFIDSDHTDNETAYAREIIAAFMSRAWRETPTSDDVDRKLQLFQRLRPDSSDFQETMVEILATILTSPKFLYVLPGEPDSRQEHSSQNDAAQIDGPQPANAQNDNAQIANAPNDQPQNQLSQHELATRLSLFLWCSLPDATLLELAAAGRLDDHDVLRQQVDRMLADPRSSRFATHFVQQWLKLRPLEFLRPTRGGKGLDSALLESMKREPIALFADMLQHDSSVLEFIDSEYLVVNERLARHYGLSGVQGNQFRRVALPADRRRGGLLTQAGLLTMNSDGQDSHPVKRGVWLLTNLLNDPPPPPPPAVPEIDLSDPKIAKMTLKERVEDHRNHAACLSCHQKIDPWGIAFENYDAMGGWRDQIDGKPVDSTSTLPGKVRLDGMLGLKLHLVQDLQAPFVKATLEKLAAFALGRRLDFGDQAAVRQITERVRKSGDGLTTMVICLVTSDLFRSK